MYEITKYIGIGIIGAAIWIAFEIWRAPLIEELPNGKYRVIKEGKKLKNLFKRKKK
jgi:hypothetical protein